MDRICVYKSVVLRCYAGGSCSSCPVTFDAGMRALHESADLCDEGLDEEADESTADDVRVKGF